MLNRLAFANSLAVLTAALYVLFAILALIAPRVFQVLFDAQFFGANVASLFPKVQTSAASLVTLVLMIGMSWVVGYAWAAAVRRIFALYASGTGLRTIAKTLTAEGAPPPTPRQRDRLPGWGRPPSGGSSGASSITVRWSGIDGRRSTAAGARRSASSGRRRPGARSRRAPADRRGSALAAVSRPAGRARGDEAGRHLDSVAASRPAGPPLVSLRGSPALSWGG